MKNPKLTLVGAGTGDPELITLKGLKALKSADVVLYDALINPKLLNYVSGKALKIFVGKRSGHHEFSQDEINFMIVEYAYKRGHVVRLKGGDPFIFGRGYEELQFAASYNLETEYIPGISSAIGVPGLKGIPATYRGVSDSVWMLTGTTTEGKLSADLKIAAQSDATIVILMGVKQLRKIVKIFQTHNKENKPVAIIQNGSLPGEKTVIGTINNIVDKAEEQNIGSPAVIIIGDVVKLHSKITRTRLKKPQLNAIAAIR